jgi:hypothetical protein
MIDYIDFKKVEEISYGERHLSLPLKALKANEEGGEFAQEVLAYIKSPNASKSAEGTVEAVLEEACDNINVFMDIINHLTRDKPELEEYVRETFDRKLNKWAAKQEK